MSNRRRAPWGSGVGGVINSGLGACPLGQRPTVTTTPPRGAIPAGPVVTGGYTMPGYTMPGVPRTVVPAPVPFVPPVVGPPPVITRGRDECSVLSQNRAGFYEHNPDCRWVCQCSSGYSETPEGICCTTVGDTMRCRGKECSYKSVYT